MMMDDDTILIENYLRGLLSDEEKQLFEKRLNTDTDFYNNYILEKQLHATLNKENWASVDKNDLDVAKYKEALQSEQLKNLKQTLSDVNSEFNSKPKKNNKLWYYLAAASIVIFIGFQLFLGQKVSNEELYYDNVDIHNLPSFAIRDANNKIQLKLVEGEKQFKKGNYQEALDVLETVLEHQKNNSLLYVYIGIAQAELGHYKASKKTFDDLIINKNQDKEVAHWYKALLYLKQEHTKEALEQLEIIIQNPNSYYYESALDLSEKIRH